MPEQFGNALFQPNRLISRRNCLGLLGAGAAAAAFGARARAALPSDALGKLLTESWQKRYAGKNGGLTLLVLAPDQYLFATTLDGVGPQSHFRGASTTKTFTAAAIMLLDQRGLLRIDDRITANMPGRDEAYLPDMPGFDIAFKDRITIRQLLSHRAGVFDLTNEEIPQGLPVPYSGMSYLDWWYRQDPKHSFTKGELISVLATTKVFHAEPGGDFHYSDSHYTLLGKIVEQVSGLPLDQFKTREFLQPLGLKDTHFVVDGSETALPVPSIHGFSLRKGKADEDDDYNYSYDPGSGNLITTPADLARWIRLLISGQTAVSPAQLARMCDVTPAAPYGLGVFRRVVDGVSLGFGHNGGTAGYLTDAFHDPATGMTFVLQCSLIDFDDLAGQMNWLAQTGLAAIRLAAAGAPQ